MRKTQLSIKLKENIKLRVSKRNKQKSKLTKNMKTGKTTKRKE